MTVANVISFDTVLRLTRANTVQSTQYSRNAERLSPVKKARLRNLEARLFAAAPSVDKCALSELTALEGRHDGPEGTIRYYYCLDLRKFVLLRFFFHDGGTGGMPIPADIDDSGLCYHYYKIACMSDTAAAAFAKIAAKFEAPRVLSYVCDTHVSAPEHSKLERAIPSFAFRRWGMVNQESLRALFATRCSADALPKWSILRRHLVASEQLQSPYARSILAGEMLCRMVSTTSIAEVVFGQRYPKGADAGELSQQIGASLDRLFSSEGLDGSDLNGCDVAFLETEAMGMLADDCSMLLRRNQMMAVLSTYIARQTSKWLHMDRRAGDARTASLRAMKKYALLADFIRTSEYLFRYGRPEYNFDMVWQECRSFGKGNVGKGNVSAKVIRDFGAFDFSICILVQHLDSSTEVFDEATDLPALHQRLKHISDELLDETPVD